MVPARSKNIIMSVVKALATSSVPWRCQTSHLFAGFILSVNVQGYFMKPKLGLSLSARALAPLSLMFSLFGVISKTKQEN